MGQITLQTPVINQPNSTEAPKIVSDFNALQTVINGNLDTNNLSAAAAIKYSQLAVGVGGLSFRSVTGTATAADGQCVFAAGTGPYTVTLPSPTPSAKVQIVSGQISNSAITVASSSGSIFGLGLASSGVASMQLGTNGASVLLQSDGTSWVIVSGQQDTGWVALSLNPSLGVGSGYTPSARLQGDTVRLKGVPAATGSIAGSSTLVAIPAGLRPSVILRPVVGINQTPTVVAINPSGALTTTTALVTNDTISLDGVTFSIS